MVFAKMRFILLAFVILLLPVNRAESRDVSFEWEIVQPGSLKVVGGGSTANVIMYGKMTDGSGMVLYKVDSNGNVLWSTTFVPPWPNPEDATSRAKVITVDQAENVYIAVQMYAQRGEYLIIAKYDSSGHKKWTRRRTSQLSEYVTALATDHSGNLYLAGRQNPFDDGNEQVFLTKYRGDGSESWTRCFGGDGVTDIPVNMVVDGEDNVIIGGGSTNPSTRIGNAFLVKYAPDGKRLWVNRIPTRHNSIPAFPLIIDASNSIHTALTTPSETPRKQITFFKFSSAGELELQQSHSGPGDTEIHCMGMAQDGRGNFVILGQHIDESRDIYQMLLLKVAPNGAPRWTRTFGAGQDRGPFEPSGLIVDAEDNAYISGHFGSSEIQFRWPGQFFSRYADHWDPYLVKYSTDGARLFGRDTEESKLCRDGAGNVYLGWTSDDEDMVLGHSPR